MRGKLIWKKYLAKCVKHLCCKKCLGAVWKTNVGKSWLYCGDLISSEKVNITLVIPFQFNFVAFCYIDVISAL